MKSKSLCCAILLLCTTLVYAEPKKEPLSFGVVNFPKCITESKYGKQEQTAFEQVKTQMTTLISEREKELQDIMAKLNDPEFIDTLSPEAEQELKAKFQTLSEEYNLYQNQSMQILNQANMRLIQTMSNHVKTASDTLSKKENLSFIFRDDVCFSFPTSADVTASVVKEMDRNFDKANKATAMQSKENNNTATPQKEQK